MAIYTLDSAKAMAAKSRIDQSSRQIGILLQQYTEAKQHLLSTWEGSMKDQFVQMIGQDFENNCQVLIKGLMQLSADVEKTNQEIIRRTIHSSNIVNG